MLLSVVCNFNSKIAARSFQDWAETHHLDVDSARVLGSTRRYFLWDQDEDPTTSGFEDQDDVLAAFQDARKAEFGKPVTSWSLSVEALCS